MTVSREPGLWSPEQLQGVEAGARAIPLTKLRVSPQVILKSEPVHPFGLAVYGEHIFWTDWVRRAVQRANKYVGSDMKLLRVDIPQQPMGIIAVANDTNSCEWGRCHQPCPSAHCASMRTRTHTHTYATGPIHISGRTQHMVQSFLPHRTTTQTCWNLTPHPSQALPAPPSACMGTDVVPHWLDTEGPPHRSVVFSASHTLFTHALGPRHIHDLRAP